MLPMDSPATAQFHFPFIVGYALSHRGSNPAQARGGNALVLIRHQFAMPVPITVRMGLTPSLGETKLSMMKFSPSLMDPAVSFSPKPCCR